MIQHKLPNGEIVEIHEITFHYLELLTINASLEIMVKMCRHEIDQKQPIDVLELSKLTTTVRYCRSAMKKIQTMMGQIDQMEKPPGYEQQPKQN